MQNAVYGCAMIYVVLYNLRFFKKKQYKHPAKTASCFSMYTFKFNLDSNKLTPMLGCCIKIFCNPINWVIENRVLYTSGSTPSQRVELRAR